MNPLSKLRANPLVWSRIFADVDDYVATKHIQRTEDAYKVISKPPFVYASRFQAEFPEPTGLNINMMPLITWNPDTHPDFIKPYMRMVWTASRFMSNYRATVYLTIHESMVPVGETQRRPGVHIESPTIIERHGTFMKQDFENDVYRGLSWGSGCYGGDLPMDGIFMASTVSNSCQIWPALIKESHLVADRHGGIEPLRPYLGEPYKIQKNEMVWMTDKTPHESLPVFADAPGVSHVSRQFFRLVLGKVSVWYAKHNTPNPLYTPTDVFISHEDKFS
jgi:hypothetical protein